NARQLDHAVSDHECCQVVSKSGVISQRQNRAHHRAIESQNVKRADAKKRAQRKRIKRHANVVRENLARTDLICLVQIFPPMRALVDDSLAKARINSRELRKIRVAARAKKSNQTEQKKDAKGRRRVAPGAPK